jgi:hypothetical protein
VCAWREGGVSVGELVLGCSCCCLISLGVGMCVHWCMCVFMATLMVVYGDACMQKEGALPPFYLTFNDGPRAGGERERGKEGEKGAL